MTDALKPFMPEELPGYFEKPGILEGLAKDHPAAIVRQLANYTLSLRNTRTPDPRIAELEAENEMLRHKAELWNFGTVLGFPRLSAVEHTGQTAQAWHHKSHIVACDTAEKAMQLAIEKESER